MRVHTHGSLWRYVRASMSLAGYLPPICDPRDGHMLMDGGYINNLPADVAKDMFGACKVIAVDVGTTEDFTTYWNFGDTLSGWQILFSKLNPFIKKLSVPGMSDIQSRLSYISNHKHLKQMKEADFCYYLRPPVQKFKTLAFERYPELESIGRYHAQAIFTDKWVQDFMCDVLEKVEQGDAKSGRNRIYSIQKNEFKDLVDVIYSNKNDAKNKSQFASVNSETEGQPDIFSILKKSSIDNTNETSLIASNMSLSALASTDTNNNAYRRRSSVTAKEHQEILNGLQKAYGPKKAQLIINALEEQLEREELNTQTEDDSDWPRSRSNSYPVESNNTLIFERKSIEKIGEDLSLESIRDASEDKDIEVFNETAVQSTSCKSEQDCKETNLNEVDNNNDDNENENKPEEEDKQIRIKSTKPEIDENNNNLKSENTTFFISDSDGSNSDDIY